MIQPRQREDETMSRSETRNGKKDGTLLSGEQKVRTKSVVSVEPGRVIRKRRELAGWKAAELARRAGINSRTLSAIELGRIASPSLKHLESLAHALGLSMASLFSPRDDASNRTFLLGNPKGVQKIEFRKDGFSIVCYTPLVHDFFVGKVILNGENQIEERMLSTAGMIFVQPIIGKLSVVFDAREYLIREGSYVFFDGSFPHTFENPSSREVSFFLVTVPSFVARLPRRLALVK